MANFIGARTADMSGAQSLSSVSDFLPQRRTDCFARVLAFSTDLFSFLPLWTLEKKVLDGLSIFTALALFTFDGSN